MGRDQLQMFGEPLETLPAYQRPANLKPYRPSNGFEGDRFEEKFCNRCEVERKYAEAEDTYGCPIAALSTAFEIGDPEYPQEWSVGPDGPFCAAFVPVLS